MYLRIEELGICRKCEDSIGGGFASVGVREGGIVLMGKDGSVNVWALSFVHDSAQSRRLNVQKSLAGSTLGKHLSAASLLAV
jgi:ATP-dependent protease HslVU (ClpYQ) peptidase subunit